MEHQRRKFGILLGLILLLISCGKDEKITLEPINSGKEVSFNLTVNDKYNTVVLDNTPKTKGSINNNTQNNQFAINPNSQARIILYKNNQVIASEDFKIDKPISLKVKADRYQMVIYSINKESLPNHNDKLLLTGDGQFLIKRETIELGSDISKIITLDNLFSQLSVNVNSEVGEVQNILIKANNIYKNPKVDLLTGEIDPDSKLDTYEISTSNPNLFIATDINKETNVSVSVTIGGKTNTVYNKPYQFSKGEWLKLNLSIKKGNTIPSVDVDGVLWAKGNLSWSKDKGYYFEDNQATVGSFWMWNYPTLTYGNLGDWELANIMKVYSLSNDPCSKIEGWKTPSKQDFENLLKKEKYFRNNGADFPKLGLFLPITGKKNFNNQNNILDNKHGAYWTSTQTGSESGSRLYFNDNGWKEELNHGFGSDYKPNMMNIRCVKYK